MKAENANAKEITVDVLEICVFVKIKRIANVLMIQIRSVYAKKEWTAKMT